MRREDSHPRRSTERPTRPKGDDMAYATRHPQHGSQADLEAGDREPFEVLLHLTADELRQDEPRSQVETEEDDERRYWSEA